MTTLSVALERTVLICARPDTVFRYFTDSGRFAAWWGAGSRIDPRPGGAVLIRYPNGVVASGEVVEIMPTTRIVFTYGYEGDGRLIAPGGSRVTIILEPHSQGTLLRLRHDCPDQQSRDAHQPGWRYQLAVFANVVSQERHAGAEMAVDRFFAVWAQPEAAERHASLEAIATRDVLFRDGFANTTGIEDLVEHIGAARQHFPGRTLLREGPVLQCQGTAVAGWILRRADQSVEARGTNVFDFSPDGRLTRVIGLRAGG
jgi:uncharacterized protein YndB with AHSA1/START domain